MNKHTQGPWQVVVRDIDNQLKPMAEGINDSYWVDSMRGISIANVGLSESNARLIAAAPEMLEALKSAVNYLDGLKGPFNHELLNLKDVIAKAEGKR